MFIRRVETVHFFCSSKCERNLLNLGRQARWTPWTKHFRRAKGLVEEEAPAADPARGGGGARFPLYLGTPKGESDRPGLDGPDGPPPHARPRPAARPPHPHRVRGI